jgi:hypothetical protein
MEGDDVITYRDDGGDLGSRNHRQVARLAARQTLFFLRNQNASIVSSL